MIKEIRGIVQNDPVSFSQCSVFAVEQGEDVYLVISANMQAAKDYIFVESGQEIIIRGGTIEDFHFKGVITAEKSRIALDQEAFSKSRVLQLPERELP